MNRLGVESGFSLVEIMIIVTLMMTFLVVGIADFHHDNSSATSDLNSDDAEVAEDFREFVGDKSLAPNQPVNTGF